MKRIVLISFLCLLAPAFSHADTYVHGSVGEAEFSSGGSPSMFEFGLGFDVGRSLIFELSYVNLGTVDSPNDEFSFIEEEADGFNAALVADVPLNDQISIYFTAGYLFWDDTARLIEDGFQVDSVVFEGEDWNFGAGIKIEIYEDLDFDFGYTEYNLDDIEVDSISAGIIYRF